MARVWGVRAPDVALLRAGIVLFVLGLVTGFAVPLMAVPRLGLSSHLEGVMNGMVLVGLGLIWPRLTLSARTGSLAFWLAIYGTFANWLATLAAALTGAAALMPIAGGGATGAPWAEQLVAALLISLSVAIVAASLFVLAGLRRPAATE